MGWWSEAVMGGDSSLDFLFEFEKLLDTKENKITAAQLEENEQLLVEKIESTKYDMDRCVGWHVLAYLMLKTGANLSTDSREKIIHAALNDVTGEWLNKKRRRIFMLDLVAKVEDHEPGQCVALATDDESLSDISPKARRRHKEEEQAIERDKDDIVDRLCGLAAFHGFELDLDRIRPLLTRCRDTSPAPKASLRKSQEAVEGLAEAFLRKKE